MGDNVAPNRVTATFEVVTPLFLGGADPASTAELRAPSIKGMLRFWWRALAWSRHGGDVDAVKEEESRLFGSAGAESGEAQGSAGQASFILRVHSINGSKRLSKGDVLKQEDRPVGSGMRYLGYGLFGEKQGQLERPCLFDHGSAAPFQFLVDLVSRRPFDSSILNALKVMGLLGGLGSRVRRGYGSLSLVSLAGDGEAWKPPAGSDDYIRQLRAAIGAETLKPEEPPYTAFSTDSRIVIASREERDPLSVLNDVGKQMQRYRSWGHKGRVDGEPSERNFGDDHDWFKEFPRAGHPRRVVFGLPHNYSRSFGITSEHHDRRGSPLSVHIHKLQNNRYIGVISILRARFLPDGEKLKVRNGSRGTLCTPQIDWKVLDGFIDGVSKNTRQPYFPNRRQVLP
jgi:CRISPR-associated protein Cmr1